MPQSRVLSDKVTHVTLNTMTDLIMEYTSSSAFHTYKEVSLSPAFGTSTYYTSEPNIFLRICTHT